jgi:hypothetical protein
MTIIKCPNCGTRVLPRPDDTCPNCHLSIHHKKRRERARYKINNKDNNTRGIYKLAGFAWYLYAISFFICIISIADNITHFSIWIWWSGIAGILLCLLVTLLLLYYGVFERRAYKMYIQQALLATFWIIPIIVSSFQLISRGLIMIVVIICSCSISFLLSYKFNYQKLSTGIAEQTGAISLSQSLWKVAKPLETKDIQSKNAKLAQLLVPLGIGIGAILSTSFSTQENLISSIMIFAIACVFSVYPGKQLAIAQYLKDIEKEFNIMVRL